MELHCRNTTAFTPDGRLDEYAMRALFQRFVDANIGVYMCSSPLEGFTLSIEEIARVYGLGVEVCKGKVFVGRTAPNGTLRSTRSRSAGLALKPGSIT